MLKVYGRGTSDNAQKVLWMAGETGQAFEHIPAGGSFGCYRLLDAQLSKHAYVASEHMTMADIPTGRRSIAISNCRSSARNCRIWSVATGNSASAMLSANGPWRGSKSYGGD